MVSADFIGFSISHLRAVEDGTAALLVILIMFLLYATITKIVKEGPLVKRLWAIIISLVPFMLWKLLGAFRRVFLEKSHYLYGPLGEFGEVMESISALFILGSLIYLFFLLKPKK